MRILIIRLSALGDVVLTTGPIKQLKEQRPDVEIHLLTDNISAPLLANLSFIDHIHHLPKSTRPLRLIKFVRNLGPFDRIIDLQAKPKTMALKFFAGRRYFAIQKQSRKRRLFVRNRLFAEELGTHVVQKYYQVLQKALGLPDQTTESLRPTILIADHSLSTLDFDFTKTVAIHPYASQKNKVWPYMEELIDHLILKGFSIVIVGQDSGTQQFLVREKVLNLTNKTSLTEMVSVIGKCQALISTDSGPMHLGVGLAIPTLAIFGPTTKEFGFYPKFKDTQVVEVKKLECRPCHVHGGNLCPLGHHRCMKDITPEKVLEHFDALLR